MLFKECALEWLDKYKNGYSKKRNLRDLSNRVFPFIGEIDMECVSISDAKNIFSKDIFNNLSLRSFYDTYNMMYSIFEYYISEYQYIDNPMKYVNYVYSNHYRNRILNNNEIFVLNSDSYFSVVAYSFIKQRCYEDNTYHLYLTFLDSYINPIIGEVRINAITLKELRRIFEYMNSNLINEVWHSQVISLLNMIFGFAINVGIIKNNPIERLGYPFKPQFVINVSEEQKKEIRNVFSKYGTKRRTRIYIVKELFQILKAEEFPTQKGKSFNDVYREWKHYYHTKNYKDNTFIGHFSEIEMFALTCFDNVSINVIKDKDIQYLIDVSNLMGISIAKEILRIIKWIFRFALERKYISKDVTEFIKVSPIRYNKRIILDDDEVVTFLFICEQEEYGYIPAFILLTDARLKEAIGITIEKIDLRNRTVLIDSQLDRKKNMIPTKTCSKRIIPFSKCLVPFIERALIYKSKHKKRLRYNLLFVNRDGDPFSRSALAELIKRIGVKMNRPDLTAHCLRHTYLNMNSRVEKDYFSMQYIAGHSHLGDSLKAYIHPNKESRIDTANKKQIYFERIFNGYECFRSINEA